MIRVLFEAPHPLQRAVADHGEPQHLQQVPCTHNKMEDRESQDLDSATKMMKTVHIQDSQTDRGKVEIPDIKSSFGVDDRPSLANLAGELQDLIITKLHPSSAIALRQTNHHFHASVNLHRLPFSVVFDWLQDKELMPSHNNYACYTCLRLKPRSAFAKRQTTSGRGTFGKASHTRICLDCALSTGKHYPGSFLEIGKELQVLCMGCEILRK